MRYRAFGDFRKGYAHVKNGSGVEDYASSYNDPEGRFYIGVICDGHSDQNCFRSAKGAQFGCESAIEILTRFFELYLSQDPEIRALPDGFENRLKKSLKLCWDKKVYNDIQTNPLQDDELMPLTDRVRKIYAAGNGLLNIYGATFLAIGMCEDFFLAFHIGDGAILCIDEDGSYYSPVPKDPKSETGAPASLCDSDLFTRENAFRIGWSKKLPLLSTVSSDGIEDCMDSFEYTRFTCSLFKRIESAEEENQPGNELNEKQKTYFESCLEYYADKGHGAEDDCSLAAIYDLSRTIPEVRMSNDEAIRLWERTMQERNEIVRDYENRKKSLLENMSQVYNSATYKGCKGISMDAWMEAHERLEEQKRTLKTIITNESDKIAYYERQLAVYAQYIDGFSDDDGKAKRLIPMNVDMSFTAPDEDFPNLKIIRQDYQKKLNICKQTQKELEEAAKAIDAAYDEAKRLAKLGRDDADSTDTLTKLAREKHQAVKEAYAQAIKEYDEIKELYETAKGKYTKSRPKINFDFRFWNKNQDAAASKQPTPFSDDKLNKSRDRHTGADSWNSDTPGGSSSSQSDRTNHRSDGTNKRGSKDKSQKNGTTTADVDFPWNL
jgi:hypothetical protein